METLQFDFGTTPEEVIRGRHADFRAAYGPESDDLYDHADIAWVATVETDDLLTVLDDLAYCALNVEKTWRGSWLPDGRPDGNGHPSAKLRIEILAALGVTEV